MALLAYDIEKSFGDSSTGRITKSIIDKKGKPILSPAIWRVGNDAVSVLQAAMMAANDENDVPLSDLEAALPDLLAEANEFLCAEFFPTFLERVDSGRTRIDVDRQLLEPIWQEYGIASRARIFLQIIATNPLALYESPDLTQFIQQIAALCILTRIDDCAIAYFMDGGGLDEASADVQFFHSHVNSPTAFFDAISAAKKMALSEAAATKAAQLHAPRNEAREWVRAEWAAEREEYGGNKSEFARHYARRIKNERGIDVTEKTIREVWLANTPTASRRAG